MPAKSAKQQRFMGFCSHVLHPPDRCPARAVAREMAQKPKPGTKKSGR